MIKQSLIIYSNLILYEILKELENEIKYKIEEISTDKELSNKEISEYLVLTDKKNHKFLNAVQLDLPCKITKLIEKVNIKFIKLKTKEKASVSVGEYDIDLNARLLNFNSESISLTEKEINLIMFLNNSKNPVSVYKLQKEVWSYNLLNPINSSDIRVVETLVSKIRKKLGVIKNSPKIVKFKEGYQILI